MYPKTRPENNFSLCIHKVFGELSNDGNWSKKLTITEWGYSNQPKFDIRMWDSTDNSDTNKRSTKGITLTLEEVQKLKEVLENTDLDHYVMPEKKLIQKFEIV